ncbi:hypothetical protein HAQ04_26250 [Pseudomonas sp. C2L11]|nr:hypothetical protein [Pseudomonas typographi]MBD1554909.1 hypothetical protein [Pseudomonas typographi]
MNELAAPFMMGAVVVAALFVGSLAMFKVFYRKVDQGIALIVNDLTAEPKVHFTGAMVNEPHERQDTVPPLR